MSSLLNKIKSLLDATTSNNQVDAPTLFGILITSSRSPILGVLKIRKRFLNFVLLPLAFQQRAPDLRKKMSVNIFN